MSCISNTNLVNSNTLSAYRSGVITPDAMAAMPAALNAALVEIVSEDIQTQVRVLPREQAGRACGCDVSHYPEQVRVVTLAGLPCPCGGTHVQSTRELAACEVTKVKKKKNIMKVSYLLKKT
jgi:Ser-tRNA(Ala) deacylase AlaX